MHGLVTVRVNIRLQLESLKLMGIRVTIAPKGKGYNTGYSIFHMCG